MALEVIQSAWLLVAVALALAALTFLRVMAMFAERHIKQHDVVREARELRLSYLKSRVDQMPTSDWEVVDE